MNINIICVGKLKEKYLKEAVSEYSKRLSRFANISFSEIPDLKISDKVSEENAVIEKEGDAILAKLKSDSYVIALCIEGKQLSSPEFAEKIGEIMMNTSNISFIIGGSLGLSERVKQRSNLKLSFGKITLPHQLMRVVLSEQIYRAFKINNNETYHK